MPKKIFVKYEWQNASRVKPLYYKCGFCHSSVSPNLGFCTNAGDDPAQPHIYLCSGCNAPTFAWAEDQYPASPIGAPVDGLPEDVRRLYEEARSCSTEHAYTSAVLISRKILMHVAVEKGAEKDKTFKDYIDYLESNHWFPPNAKVWVDRIRKQGNEANHEIVIKESKDATEVLGFAEMLLRFVYELPAKASNFLDRPEH